MNFMHNHKKRVILNKAIAVLYKNSRVFMDQYMEAYGLSSGQYTYIFYLLENDGVSQDEISKGLELDKASTTRALQKLEESGFVERIQDEKDKRVNRVYLTEAGRALQTPLQESSAKLQQLLLEGVTETEHELLLNLLERMMGNAFRNKMRGVK